jgi:hypothetical protein
MTPEERQLITGLFDRLKGAANAPRDPEAEALIIDAVRQQPYAAYVFAQTVIVQEEALKGAAARIQDLEVKLEAEAAKAREVAAAGSSSFLGGFGKSLFGSEPARPAAPSAVPPTGPRTGSGVPAWGGQPQQPGQPMQAPGGPWGGAMGAQPGMQQPQQGGMFGGGGGGFLKGAMATAAGVAGGALLYQGISSMFSGNQGATGAQSLLNPTAGETTGGAAGPADTASIGSDIFNPASTSTAGLTEASYDEEDNSADDAGYDDGGDDGWA